MSFTSETRSLLQRVPLERLLPIYERHDVAANQGARALFDEICLDGANTIASLFRGWEGVQYGEIVADVAEQLGIPISGLDARQLETAILEAIIRKYLENATPEQREDIADVLRESGADFNSMGEQVRNGVFTAGLLALLIREFGQNVVGQVVGKILLRIAGRQVARQAGKRAAALAGLAIPILNVVMIGWTVVDIAGPAFRKTVPTVIELALLRMEYGEEKQS